MHDKLYQEPGDGTDLQQSLIGSPDLVRLESHFLSFAQARSQMAGLEKTGENGARIMARLKATHESSGTIYCIGLDRFSAISAAHLQEELGARYKAGSKMTPPRGDREAVRAVNISDISRRAPSQFRSRVLSYCTHPNDTLVVFAATEVPGALQEKVVRTLEVLRKMSIHTSVVAPAGEDLLLEAGATSFPVPSDNPDICIGIQSTLLHAMCEGLEPEAEGLGELAKCVFPSMLGATANIERRIAEDERFLVQILRARAAITERLASGECLFATGNGGSACDALQLLSHFEDVQAGGKYVKVDRDLLSPGYLTCCQNDGFDAPLRGVDSMRDGGVVVAYTTSGNSENMIKAVEKARQQDVLTVVLTGGTGGKIRGLGDHELIVPYDQTGAIQEVHWTIGSGMTR